MGDPNTESPSKQNWVEAGKSGIRQTCKKTKLNTWSPDTTGGRGHREA